MWWDPHTADADLGEITSEEWRRLVSHEPDLVPMLRQPDTAVWMAHPTAMDPAFVWDEDGYIATAYIDIPTMRRASALAQKLCATIQNEDGEVLASPPWLPPST